ncbi:hypothetical protein [Arthrobacter rhizosphaerae]|uniref:hypothetical protein n=1 Tax=Arthrobacter rhizosphaerae TaxID=2855490 RepID=UPI001FF62F88|nr:hypothetical protein [Arthrobacter rhizosphaerae]
MRSKLSVLASVFFGAVSNSAVPISALLLMSRADFGIFSIVYLIFALGWSLALSLVCDSWSRTKDQGADRDTFRWVQLQLAILVGLVGGTVAGGLFQDGWLGFVAGVAVLATLYRVGSRYQETVLGGAAKSLMSDATTVVTLVAGVVIFRLALLDWTPAITYAWALSGLAGSAFYGLRPRSASYGLLTWVKVRRETIKPLLGDSLLMDAGASWAPLAIAPFMSVTSYATYRAVSSVATPVQFVLDPLRPALSVLSPRRTSSGRWIVSVLLAGTFMAAVCWSVLVLVVGPLKIGGETLVALVEFATPTSVFVLANFIGHFYYISARSHASHRRLLQGRIFQTIVSIALPFAGLAALGLAGAIWGFAIAALCSGLLWLRLAGLVARDGSVAEAAPSRA